VSGSKHPPGPDFDPHRAAIRQRGHRVTPYRIGVQSGNWLDNLPCPYAPRSIGERNFLEGVKYGSQFGRALRADLLRWLAKATTHGAPGLHA
jgi:hypothetical protein